MNSKAIAIEEQTLDNEYYLEQIQKYIKGMDQMRVEMKKTDAEIRRLKASTRKKLNKTWEIIRDLEATL